MFPICSSFSQQRHYSEVYEKLVPTRQRPGAKKNFRLLLPSMDARPNPLGSCDIISLAGSTDYGCPVCIRAFSQHILNLVCWLAKVFLIVFFSTVFPGVIYCLGRSANWAEIGSSRWYRATPPPPPARQPKTGGTGGTVPAQYAAGASQAAI